jgi:hypothetical protein
MGWHALIRLISPRGRWTDPPSPELLHGEALVYSTIQALEQQAGDLSGEIY